MNFDKNLTILSSDYHKIYIIYTLHQKHLSYMFTQRDTYIHVLCDYKEVFYLLLL